MKFDQKLGRAQTDITLSVVVPCHNELDALPVFFERVVPVLESMRVSYELVFVDDGSTDETVKSLLGLSSSYRHVRIVELSRNFGKEAALTAGLSHAIGRAVIPMDCDLQDPPEIIPEMLAKWRSGHKVVHAVRRCRKTDTRAKRVTASVFYSLMGSITDIKIPANCGDFRLMDRVVVDAIMQFPERNRFNKGIMAAAGFKATTVEYDRPERSAGETKFNFWKLWNFALDGIVGFSTLPLRIWTYFGLAIAGVAFCYGAWIIFKTVYWGVVTPGFATLMTAVLFLGAVQLIGIGVLGEYVGRIITETKQRPIFVVDNLYGFDELVEQPRKEKAA